MNFFTDNVNFTLILNLIQNMKNFLILLFATLTFSCSQNWSYEGKTNPQNWGLLKEDFKFCKIGYNQSPIDVNAEFKDSELKFSYGNSDVEKRQKNYVLQFEFERHDFVLRAKKKYFTRYIEFHHPSEHLISGEQYSLELQIFHKSDDEQWLALAILVKIGKENPAFNDLIKLMRSKEIEGKLNLSKIIKEDDKTFFYDGSFTTPPCTEGVKWYVMKTALKISKEQMNQIIKLGIFTKSNARPPQEFHLEKY